MEGDGVVWGGGGGCRVARFFGTRIKADTCVQNFYVYVCMDIYIYTYLYI